MICVLVYGDSEESDASRERRESGESGV